MPRHPSTFQRQLNYLGKLNRFAKIKPGLTTMRQLLQRLNHPQQQFPSVHIAGTNGKGSTAAFIASILQASGLRVGLYTSPHLRRFNERIVINGRPIANRSLSALVSAVKNSAHRHHLSPTYFEFTTAIAFLYFAQRHPDIAVIEVGMGGDLDATNVITPLLSIITNIDLDHTSWLGRTKLAIAAHKAGIIKPDVPVLTAEDNPRLLSLIADTARRRHSSVYQLHQHLTTSPASHTLRQQTFAVRPIKQLDSFALTLPRARFTIPLLGQHQITNAATALLAAQLLHRQFPTINLSTIRRGLRSTRWSGRFDIFSRRPFIVLDGAHNEAGLKALALTLTTYSLPPAHTLLLGLKQDKDPGPVIKYLVPLFRRIIITQSNYQPYPAHQLSSLITASARYNPTSCQLATLPTLSAALRKAMVSLPPRTMLLITGSLYLVGDALSLLAKKTPHR